MSRWTRLKGEKFDIDLLPRSILLEEYLLLGLSCLSRSIFYFNPLDLTQIKKIVLKVFVVSNFLQYLFLIIVVSHPINFHPGKLKLGFVVIMDELK